jgi:hypothetical protein
MNPKETLKQLLERKRSSEDSQLLGAASLVTATGAKEFSDASVLLAKTTRASAGQLRKDSEISVRQIKK